MCVLQYCCSVRLKRGGDRAHGLFVCFFNVCFLILLQNLKNNLTYEERKPPHTTQKHDHRLVAPRMIYSEEDEVVELERHPTDLSYTPFGGVHERASIASGDACSPFNNFNCDTNVSETTRGNNNVWLHEAVRTLLEEMETSRTRQLCRPTERGETESSGNWADLSIDEEHASQLQLLEHLYKVCARYGNVPGGPAAAADAMARHYLLASHSGLSPLLRPPNLAMGGSSATAAPLLLRWHDETDSSPQKEDPPATLRLPTSYVRLRDDSSNDELLASAAPLKQHRWEGCQVPWQNRPLTSREGLADAPPRKLHLSEAFARRARSSQWSVARPPSPQTSTDGGVQSLLPPLSPRRLELSTSFANCCDAPKKRPRRVASPLSPFAKLP